MFGKKTYKEISPLHGDVVEVCVKRGQKIAVGDRLIILEAMKMNIPLTSKNAGKIHNVLVGKGDSVVKGQELVRIREG